MDWAFATFTVTAALDTTQPITELRVAYFLPDGHGNDLPGG